MTELRKEMQELRSANERLEREFEDKNNEMVALKQKLDEKESLNKSDDQIKVLWSENESLRNQLTRLQDQNDSENGPERISKVALQQINSRLVVSVNELKSIQQELTNLSVS